MHTLFLVATVFGATLWIAQFTLSLFGIGDGHDAGLGDGGADTDGSDADHDGWFAGLLSFRALVAALTAFGLAGLAADAAHWSPLASVAAAIVVGLLTMALVAVLMRSLQALGQDSTVRIERAMDATGVVYLTIPPDQTDAGKILLTLGGRTVELRAVTRRSEPIPSGAPIRVTDLLGPDLVEVIPDPLAPGASRRG